MNYDYYILQKDNHAIIVSNHNYRFILDTIIDNKNRKTLKIGVGVYMG